MKIFDEKALEYITDIQDIEFEPISNKIWKAIEWDGFCEEAKDWEGDFTRSHYTFAELSISEFDKQGLITGDFNTSEKFNQFDIYIKDEIKIYPEYLDFIDYENGKIYLVRYKAV